MIERKPRLRVNITCILVAQNEASGQRTIFYTEDISATGALIRPAFGSSSDFLIDGKEYLLTLQLPAIDQMQHEIACLGKIVRSVFSEGGSRFGIHFNFFNQGARDILIDYINRFIIEFPDSVT